MQTPVTPPRATRRYLATLGGGLILSVVAIASMNVAMDPYGVYRGFGEDRKLSPKAGIGSRIGMAERVRQLQFDTALVGSSRVAAGFNDTSPHLGGRSTVNLGMPSSNFYEIGPLVRYTIAEGGVKRVLLFVDFYQFTSRRKGDFDFAQSRFNPELSPVDYHCDKLLGWNVTRQSFSMLRGKLQGSEPMPVASLGSGDGEPVVPVAVGGNPRARFEKTIRSYLTVGYFYGRYQYSPERVEIFRDAVRSAHAQGVELHVAVCPVHALQLETVRAAGLWEVFEDWKRDLARVVAEENQVSGCATPVWDFSGYTSFPIEPVPGKDSQTGLVYYSESSHFTRALGEEVLARMLTPGGNPQFGVLLTPDTIEERLAQVREDRQRWALERQADVEWVDQIAMECGYTAPAVLVSSRDARRMK